MEAIFGQRWTSGRTAADFLKTSKELWGKFISPLTIEEINRGLGAICIDATGQYSAPPTPTRFVFLAKGLIDVDKAIVAARNGEFTHQAISIAWKFATSRKTTMEDEERVFKRHYAFLCDKVVKGEKIDNLDKKQLPSPTKTNQTRNEYISYMAHRFGESVGNIVKLEYEMFDMSKNECKINQYVENTMHNIKILCENKSIKKVVDKIS